MREFTGLVDQDIGHPVTDEYATERQVARCDAFCERHEIRSGAVIVRAKPFAKTAETGYDLVGDQQDAVLITNSLYFRPVTVGWHDDPARTLDRLADECGNLVCTYFLDFVFYRARRGDTEIVWRHALVRAKPVRLIDMDDAGNRQTTLLVHGLHAAEARGCNR